MSIAVKSGLPSLGSTEGAVITKDDISVTEETSPSASAGEDLPRGKSAYEVAVENGFSGTETEWLASLKGATGAPGANGKDGTDGKTPYVGDNGNWFVGSDDTGKPSRGAKGDKGDTGATPNLTVGTVTTLEAGQNATASMGGTAESPVLNLGIPRGAKGEPGMDGVTPTFCIESVETGEPGTDADVTMTGDAPNHGLRFVIPRGDKGEKGDTDISLGLTSAAVGQTIKVKAIDESGKPTEWETADMSEGIALDTTLTQSGKAADAKAVGDALAEKQPKGDYLTQDNLQSATDAALAQAKASGEFDGTDGKTAYQYAQDGGYTGTETEFAEKLAQEQLAGTTGNLTPTQVYEAVSAGIPVKVQYTDSTYGLLSFTAFNVAESLNVIVSQTIVYYNGVYILAELVGEKSGGTWAAMFTTLAQKTDIPSALPNPNALTFTGAVTGSYDGSNAKTVNIPSAVTDDHINSLIDTKLGVIENGAY